MFVCQPQNKHYQSFNLSEIQVTEFSNEWMISNFRFVRSKADKSHDSPKQKKNKHLYFNCNQHWICSVKQLEIIILSWSNSGRVSKMMSVPCLQKTLPVACCVLLWIIYPLALICQSMKYYKCDSAWQNNETLKKAVFNDFSIESFPENVMNTYMELYCFFLFFSLFQISLISSS